MEQKLAGAAATITDCLRPAAPGGLGVLPFNLRQRTVRSTVVAGLAASVEGP